jgi:hypothetical protein
MTILAIGPRSPNPSWDWIGLALAEDMRRTYDVVLFDHLADILPADIVLVIKQRPSHQMVCKIRATNARFYFAPIDVYREEAEIYADVEMLRHCDAVFVHSETLYPVLAPFCQRIHLVEHHARYALSRLVPFRDEGFLLWIGGFQHIPYVLDWLRHNPPSIEVRLLTDIKNKSARLAAHIIARQISLPLSIANGAVNGWPAELWSEATQTTLMAACKAAIDIKGPGFNQATKPPTKAQQFVASGIPFACNAGHSAVPYFHNHGFDVAMADQFSRLLSKKYWAATQAFSPLLASLTSRRVVHQAYESLLSGAAA